MSKESYDQWLPTSLQEDASCTPSAKLSSGENRKFISMVQKAFKNGKDKNDSVSAGDKSEAAVLDDLKASILVADKINPVKIADIILAEKKIIFCAGNFYRYADGYYKLLDVDEIKKWIKDILGWSFTLHRAREVIENIRTEVRLSVEELNNTSFLNLKKTIASETTHISVSLGFFYFIRGSAF